MSTTRTLALAFALLAPPLAAQTAPRAAQPGWIGFFAGFEQSPSAARPVAIVLAVAEGSPAARVGLAEGDTLLAVDGAPLTPEALKTLAAGLRAGEQVELTLRRAGTLLMGPTPVKGKFRFGGAVLSTSCRGRYRPARG